MYYNLPTLDIAYFLHICCILKRACHPSQFLHGEAFMATAANKNKIRTFETEIGPQNKNIEAGQNFTGS